MKSQKLYGFLKFNVALLMILVSTILCYSNVNADDTNLGRTPDGVFPFKDNDIVMEAEEITVDIDKRTVECIFEFHNTGKDKDILMGFPGKIRENEYDDLFNADDVEIKNFKTYIKGKELPVTCEKSLKMDTLKQLNMQDYSEFFTFSVPFKADEKITIRNTYDFTPTYDSVGSVYCGYILETGAMWKGNIGSAKVTFKLGSIKPYQLEKIIPGGYKFEGNNIVWTRNNFEPTYNLQLTYNCYQFTPEYLSDLKEYDNNFRISLIQKMDNYNKIKKLADEGKTKELISLYNKAVKEYDNIMTLYIGGFIPSDKIVKQETKIGNLEIEKSKFDDNYFYSVSCSTIGEEPVSKQITISHIEKGKVIIDASEKDINSLGTSDLTPGVEYNVTFKIIDWIGKTQSKSIKYMVPKQTGVSTEHRNQSSEPILVADTNSSDASVTVENNNKDTDVSLVISNANTTGTNEAATDSQLNEQSTDSNANTSNANLTDAANNSNISSDKSQQQVVDGPVRGINIKVVVATIIGVVLLGISVVAVIKLRRKEQA